ncbi:predicted acetyltransferase [Candidatus Vecturithrix granuli]|uniref:Predicted acetyltransferase n=1 Tax=Vecturithrix granuli TaxID=1499967 RepID=A0A081BX27_VECG1|nr:predicted acetyltransferase [Candidatus Vecturithrix granuli]
MKAIKMYQTIRTKYRNLYEYYQKYGLRKAIVLIIEYTGLFKKRVLVFFEQELQVHPTPNNDHDIELVRLEKKDIEPIDQYCDGWFPKEEALRRLEQGRVLLVVKDRETNTFYQWLEFSKVDIPYLDLSFSIPEHTACMAYIYTVPEYRGRGIASRAKLPVLQYLREHGYYRIFLMIKPDNAPSQRVNKKAGFKEYQTVFYLKLCFLKYYSVRDCETNRKKIFWGTTAVDQELWKTFSKIGHN